MVAELLVAYNKLCALGMVVVMDLLHGTDCVCVCVCMYVWTIKTGCVRVRMSACVYDLYVCVCGLTQTVILV